MAGPTLDEFQVPLWRDGRTHKSRFALARVATDAKPFSAGSKPLDRERITALGLKLDALQDVLHAQHRRRVLLVLQGTDTSGKDGTIRAVLHELDPLGVRVEAFRAPSEFELAHDFLWRVHARVPAAGELTIFNRSHYEDVLVPWVNGTLDGAGREARYQQIRDFERLLAQNGTTIIKCFLHISKDTQRERLQARIDDPTKHWKFDPSDLDARKSWDDYQAAYQDALTATSTDYAPWYVIPADSKTHRNLMVAELLHREVAALKLEYPAAPPGVAGLKIK